MNASDKGVALPYLVEIRSRLIRALCVVLGIFLISLCFANQLYTWMAQPLLKYLPQGHLIATQIVSPVFVPFKLAFLTAVLLAIPFALYQIWGFVSPALYVSERRWAWLFIIFSAVLFYTGLGFAYFVIFPLLFQFLANTVPVGVQLTPDISEYLDFTIKLLLIFGVLFEIPIMMLLLVRLNVVACSTFIKRRSYAIIGAFIIGMLLAPPDVWSQTILALPIWMLYELGIGIAYFMLRNRA